jgi:hypothetical protein
MQMDLSLQEGLDNTEEFTHQNNNGFGVILPARKLDHRLRSWIGDVDLSEDEIAVVRDDKSAYRIKDHFQHRLWT